MPTEECPFKAGDTVCTSRTNMHTIEDTFWSDSLCEWRVRLVGHGSDYAAGAFTLVESATPLVSGIASFFRDMEGKYQT